MGWLWYLGMLVPVIGLVQVGSQSMADRYTYLPLVGIFIGLVWTGAALAGRWRWGRIASAATGVTLVLLCIPVAAEQVRFWANSETLFRHALAVDDRNAPAHMNLGVALVEKGELEEAGRHFAEALRIWPHYAEAQSNLGFVLASQGKWNEAVAAYRAALALNPRISQVHYLLGSALLSQGKAEEALPEYGAALELDPSHPLALNDLAWLLATATDARLRDGKQAVSLGERLCRLTNYKVPQYLGTLAAAYAEAGRFDEAATTAERARELAAGGGDAALAQRNAQLLQLYRQGKAYHGE